MSGHPHSFPADRDDRKSAALLSDPRHRLPAKRRVAGFDEARRVLRDPALLQAGPGADRIRPGRADHVPVFYLDGEPHRRRRAAIARLFTPKAISDRYQAVMERATETLLGRVAAAGTARLDAVSFELAIVVAADIIGLTATDPLAMARRLSTLLDLSFAQTGGLRGLAGRLRRNWYGYLFFTRDVRPAIRARRVAPAEDVISQTLEQGYADRDILIECMTYAAAGMLTTREFIVMVAWHLFDRPELRDAFLTGSEKEQLAMLREILRLEPVATYLWRRSQASAAPSSACPEILVDVRAANLDPAAVGPCPHAIDPGRATREGEVGEYLSFGDGNHRCPGAQVALNETRVFIDRLFRVPGIRLLRPPTARWNPHLMSYELRDAIIGCG